MVSFDSQMSVLIISVGGEQRVVVTTIYGGWDVVAWR